MPMQSMEHQNWEGMYPNLFPRKFEKLNFMVRFVVGRPLDNKARTDSSFFHAATKGYPSRWLRLPGYARAGVRLSSLYLLLLVGVLLLAAWVGRGEWVRGVLLLHALSLVAVALPAGAVRFVVREGLSLPRLARVEEESGTRLTVVMVRVVEGRARWEREKVLPLAKVLGPLLQIEHRRLRPHEARRWVQVPRSYLSPKGEPVVIELPPHFSGADERHCSRVVKAAGNALGAAELVASWQLAGDSRRLLLSAPELPPTFVSLSSILSYLEAAEEYRPVLGMVSPEKVLQAEMIADSPHILISAGPGAGKSSLLKSLVAQFMHWGWGVVVLDWKRTQQFEWLKELPGVVMLNEIEAIHDMGVRIREEIEIRMSQGMEGRAKFIVVRDEWNVTATMLQDYWVHYRATLEPEERKVTPVKSPGLQGFNVLDFAGREYGAHDLLAGQRASNRMFNFNIDMRECFGIRLLARFTPETKRLLVGNMRPFPKRDNTPGRWVAVSDDQAAVVQAVWMENDEAREYAMSGSPRPMSPFRLAPAEILDYRGNGVAGSDMHATQGDQLPLGLTGVTDSGLVLDDVIPSIRPMKLRQMAESLEHFGITLKILQHAAGNPDSLFPAPIDGNQFKGYEYDLVEVKEWARRRYAVLEVERERRKKS